MRTRQEHSSLYVQESRVGSGSLWVILKCGGESAA
jgi:hypothetical protein